MFVLIEFWWLQRANGYGGSLRPLAALDGVCA